MHAQRGARRGRRGLPAAVVAALAAVALVLAPTALDGARASFSAATVNSGDQWAADQLQPPADLTATLSCTTASAITQRTATSAATPSTGASSVTLAMPSGTAAGDLLVAHVAYHDGGVTLGKPGTWTLLDQVTSGTNVTSAVYWRVAGPSEPSVTFTHPEGATAVMAAGLLSFVGARSIGLAIADQTNTGPTASTPTLYTPASNVMVAHLFSKTREALPAPTGMTNRYERATGLGSGNVGVSAVVEPMTNAGTTTSRSATSSTNESSRWAAQVLVVQRGVPSAQLSWTASPSTWATGYVLERLVGASVQATSTLSGRTNVNVTQNSLVNGTDYTFRLTAASSGTWRSTSVSVPFDATC